MTTASHPSDYECIEPGLGEQLWRRADPDCPAELAARLETHLVYCAYCRLQAAVEDRTVAGLRDGSLRLAPGPGRWQVLSRWTAGAGLTALAAGLALVLLLPPRAPHEDLLVRGDEAPAIERPVPDEVIRGGHPTVRWTPLAGARIYKIDIEAVGGGYQWTTTTPDASVAVPAGRALPRGERFRVSVEPVPAHVAPELGLRSSFRTGSTGEWFGYRLQRGATGGRLLGGFGLVSLLVAGLVGLVTRRGE